MRPSSVRVRKAFEMPEFRTAEKSWTLAKAAQECEMWTAKAGTSLQIMLSRISGSTIGTKRFHHPLCCIPDPAFPSCDTIVHPSLVGCYSTHTVPSPTPPFSITSRAFKPTAMLGKLQHVQRDQFQCMLQCISTLIPSTGSHHYSYTKIQQAWVTPYPYNISEFEGNFVIRSLKKHPQSFQEQR